MSQAKAQKEGIAWCMLGLVALRAERLLAVGAAAGAQACKY